MVLERDSGRGGRRAGWLMRGKGNPGPGRMQYARECREPVSPILGEEGQLYFLRPHSLTGPSGPRSSRRSRGCISRRRVGFVFKAPT
ncbi:protein of unknown function [Methylococcus capsulatus]|uniref:Uncharacterized protein n=1 Tax=Methylococcus capsulatus TaxID=414 RepID=A0AA35UX82_METCP|nr:protein of unknown function [Methylococcus capsulatus]